MCDKMRLWDLSEFKDMLNLLDQHLIKSRSVPSNAAAVNKSVQLDTVLHNATLSVKSKIVLQIIREDVNV